MIAAAGGSRMPLVVGAAALAAWPMILSSAYDLRVFALAGVYAISGDRLSDSSSDMPARCP